MIDIAKAYTLAVTSAAAAREALKQATTERECADRQVDELREQLRALVANNPDKCDVLDLGDGRVMVLTLHRSFLSDRTELHIQIVPLTKS